MLPPRILRAQQDKKMTSKNKLAAVPDTSMLSLYKSLVSFLMKEAELRGWDDVSEKLKAVEAAIASRGNA